MNQKLAWGHAHLRMCFKTMLCLGQDFWGTPVSPYLNFRGTFANSGGHTKSIWFLPVKWIQFSGNFSSSFFRFELDVDSLGSRRGADYSEVVLHCRSWIPQQIFYFYIKIAFSGLQLNKICLFHHCCCIGLVEKSIINATFIISQYMCSLNCAFYFPLLGYAKYRNGV